MAMVIPSEIINVMHAQSLRSYMGEICSKILIIDPKEIWFENTLQGAVIIMAEKKPISAYHLRVLVFLVSKVLSFWKKVLRYYSMKH